MRSSGRLVIAALALATLPGCSGCGRKDSSGMYRVTAHLVDSAGCGPGTVPTRPATYVRLTKQEYDLDVSFMLETCENSSPSSCSGVRPICRCSCIRIRNGPCSWDLAPALRWEQRLNIRTSRSMALN